MKRKGHKRPNKPAKKVKEENDKIKKKNEIIIEEDDDDDEIENTIPQDVGLKRTKTIEIEDEVIQPLQNPLLEKRRSSILLTLLADKEGTSEDSEEVSKALSSSLSFKSQQKLQKRLSSILLQPRESIKIEEVDPTIITITPFSRGVEDNEGIFEQMLDSAEEQQDEEEEEEMQLNLSDLPSELIVQIFMEMPDDDRWNFALTSRRYLAIFSLYVGWKNLILFHSDDLDYIHTRNDPHNQYTNLCVVAPRYMNYNRFYRHQSLDTRFTKSERQDICFIVYEDSGENEEEDEDMNNNNTNYRLPRNQRDNLFIPYIATRSNFFEYFFNNWKNPDYSWKTKRIVGIIPVGSNSSNVEKVPTPFRTFPFLDTFLLDGTEVTFSKSEKKRPATITKHYGKDYSKYFLAPTVTFHSRSSKSSEDPNIIPKCTMELAFRIFDYGKAAGNLEFVHDDFLKRFILFLLQTNVTHKAKSIRWTRPIPATMKIQPAVQPSEINANLYHYQLCGISWMRSIEKNAFRRKVRFCAIHAAPGYPMTDFYLNSGPFDTSEFIDPSNFEMIRESDDISYETRPDLYDSFMVRGGFMSDEMGLGKTVTMISLLLSSPREADANGKYHKHPDDPRDEAIYEIKASLILCPSHLVDQWKNEFTKYSVKTLKIVTITTMAELKELNYDHIISADAVIVSHQFIKNNNYLKQCGKLSTINSRAHTALAKGKINVSKPPLLQHFGWHRIILDEGHELLSSSSSKNEHRAEGKELFAGFLSNYRWYVTGTPVPRGRASIVGALNFLDISLSSGYELTEAVNSKLAVYEVSLFSAAKRILFWKHTKEEVKDQLEHIPPPVEHIIYVELSEFEQALYRVATIDNDKKSMKMICSYPYESSIFRNIQSTIKNHWENRGHSDQLMDEYQSLRSISHVVAQITTYYKREVKLQQALIQSLKSNLKKLNEKLPKAKRKLAEITAAGYRIRVGDEEFHKQHAKATKRVENIELQQSQLDRKIQRCEEAIIAIISKSACFSQIISSSDSQENNIICSICNHTSPHKWQFSMSNICSHTYCPSCITEHLQSKTTCPSCQTTISTSDIKPMLKPIKDEDNLYNRDRIHHDYYRHLTLANNYNRRGSNNNNNSIERASKYGNHQIIKSMNMTNLKKLKKRVVRTFGSKIATLVEWTNTLLISDPTAKIIVFSRADDILITFSYLIDKFYELARNSSSSPPEEYPSELCVSCRGSVTFRKRAIDEFNSTSLTSPRILLLSLANAASGTHLTVASHILLVDALVGSREEVKAADSQAIARSHRIGQQKDVTVIRFLVKNSVEEEEYLNVYGNN